MPWRRQATQKRFRPRPRWRPLYAAGCRRGRTPDASQMIRVTRMVQRITQAPPPRLTYSCLLLGDERPIFPLRFELFTFEPVAFASTALGSFLLFLLAPALLTLPFAAPAFRGLAA